MGLGEYGEGFVSDCGIVLAFVPMQSYGGFVVAHALGDPDQKVFSCGISVAPVTDWRYYGEKQYGYPLHG